MTDLVEKLRYMASLERGTPFPPPLWADDPDWQVGSWDTGIKKLLHEAIKEIEQLRAVAGVVDAMYSFREIKQEIRNG